MEFIFPPDYPFSAPKIHFCTPIYHPNIVKGVPILEDFTKKWSPAITGIDLIVLML